ncbi:hypothetical protein roselon_02392 [Roseibacterium elongatum DSM 19469]|uniref:Uncharacterized protein n=1 Tax=Roseicyclus elongatus DSM 19469 TaxID=1294273 RepID=W8RU13_9RHOB|nr:hypothetical protein [Roseibacterium elongatum]AHM04719.1 hypothetical protein roselon_02392 [Roseibacterium elongatum DSM 19469]
MGKENMTGLMWRVVLGCIWLMAVNGAAVACPTWQMAAARYDDATGAELWQARSYTVSAGGAFHLQGCGFPDAGHVARRPTLEFWLRDMAAYSRVSFRAAGSCDTVLLLHDPAGGWWFDDDGADGLNARLTLWTPPEGIYDIWVGTYDGRTCAATLTVESF